MTQKEKPEENIAKPLTAELINKVESVAAVKMIKGIFRNLETPGCGVSFPLRLNKGPVKQWTFFDNGEYEIPIDVAQHLNRNCAYKSYKWVSDDGSSTVTGKPLINSSMPNFRKVVDKITHRFAFQSLEAL